MPASCWRAKACIRLPRESALPSMARSASSSTAPFAETKELIAGYWLWQVRDMDEALEWIKRCPNPMPGPSEIEIRQVFEAADFGEAFTPELVEQEERLRGKDG